MLRKYGKCLEGILGSFIVCAISIKHPRLIDTVSIFLSQEKGNIDVAIRYYLVAIEVCDSHKYCSQAGSNFSHCLNLIGF